MDDASAQRLHLSQRPRGDHLPQSKAGRKSPPDHGREGGAPPAERRTETANPLPLLRCWTPRERRAKRPKNEAHARARRPRTPPGPTTTAPCRQHTPSAREASTLRTSDPRPHPASRRPAMQSLGARAADWAVVGWLLPATRVSELDRPHSGVTTHDHAHLCSQPAPTAALPESFGHWCQNPLNRPGGLSAIFVNLNRRAATPLGNRVRWFPSRFLRVFSGARSRRLESLGASTKRAPRAGFRVPWSRASRLR